MRSVLRLSALLLALVLVVACGDDDEPVAAGDGTTVPAGTSLAEEYVSVEVSEDGSPRPLVEGTSITLRFDGDRLGASLGCNQIGGTYQIEGDRLVVGELAMTEMGCAPDLHAQDEWFAGFLGSEPTVAVAGDTLTLRSATSAVSLVDRDAAEPQASLVGTTWEVDSFADGQDPDSGTMAFGVEEPGLVRFEERGVVTGRDGCNRFGSGAVEGADPEGLRYELDGDQLRFSGTPITTEIACPDLGGYVERFWSALTGTATWSIEGDRLRLVGEDGRVVSFRAAG